MFFTVQTVVPLGPSLGLQPRLMVGGPLALLWAFMPKLMVGGPLAFFELFGLWLFFFGQGKLCFGQK